MGVVQVEVLDLPGELDVKVLVAVPLPKTAQRLTTTPTPGARKPSANSSHPTPAQSHSLTPCYLRREGYSGSPPFQSELGAVRRTFI
jgi:hypothetical protein